jgi:dTMP kinase
MVEGRLIVLEGVDGAGTTTHTRLLAKSLRERKLPVHATQEPSNGPIGSLLRQTLTGRVVGGGAGGASGPPAWNAMALMFAADRLDHLDTEIMPNLREGLTVLCDRYDHSSVVYQSITAGGGADTVAWIRALNRFARRPDLTLVLDVPPEVAAERRKIRRGSDIFDEDAFQRGINGLYRELERFFPDDRIEHVNADRAVEVVAADILTRVERARSRD